MSESMARDVLSKLMGHKDEATTRFYYEVRDRRAAAEAFAMTGTFAESHLVEIDVDWALYIVVLSPAGVVAALIIWRGSKRRG